MTFSQVRPASGKVRAISLRPQRNASFLSTLEVHILGMCYIFSLFPTPMLLRASQQEDRIAHVVPLDCHTASRGGQPVILFRVVGLCDVHVITESPNGSISCNVASLSDGWLFKKRFVYLNELQGMMETERDLCLPKMAATARPKPRTRSFHGSPSCVAGANHLGHSPLSFQAINRALDLMWSVHMGF